MACDPNWSSVQVLCHCDGSNGGTTFTDSGPTGHTLSAQNGATTATNQIKFGTAAQGNGTTLGSVKLPSTSAGRAAGDFLAGQFTVELWAYANASVQAGTHILAAFWLATGGRCWRLLMSGGSLTGNFSTDGSTTTQTVAGAQTVAQNQWNAFAMDRDSGGTVRVYYNGAVVASGAVNVTLFTPTTASVRWGNDDSASGNWLATGEIDEVRITKGVARYAGAYTPATAAFPTGACTNGVFFKGPFGRLEMPSPGLVAAFAPLLVGRALARNAPITRRRLLRP